MRETLSPPSGLSPPVPPAPESDTTDDSGTVICPGLTPTSGSQLYSLGIASADLPSLYYQVPVANFDLSPTEVTRWTGERPGDFCPSFRLLWPMARAKMGEN